MEVIYYVLKDNHGNEFAAVDTWEKYHADTFNPLIKTICIIDFVIRGKTYKEKKENLREKAIDFTYNTAPGLFWSDEITLQEFFEKNGRRYGLLKEFKNNGLC